MTCWNTSLQHDLLEHFPAACTELQHQVHVNFVMALYFAGNSACDLQLKAVTAKHSGELLRRQQDFSREAQESPKLKQQSLKRGTDTSAL